MAALPAYVPGLYLPGNLGRYRSYPRTVTARIPGTGYRVGKLVWGEQALDLDGNAQRYPYGRYASVPLRGFGSYVGVGQLTTPNEPTRPAAPIALYLGLAGAGLAAFWLMMPRSLRPNRRRRRKAR